MPIESTHQDRVRVSFEDHIAHVQLANPERHNCLDMPMFRGIVEAGEAVAELPGLRAVVLSGEGPSFCSGLDFMGVMSSGPDAISELIDTRVGPANLAQRVAWIWRELKVPVIAAMHGAVYGGGLQLAMGADVRVCHPEARLSVLEIKWGIIPDMGLTQTMRGLVRPDVLAELVWTGRKLAGEEAALLGLATHLSETPVQDALELAATIAGRNPDAIQAAKAMLRGAQGLDAEASFDLETELQRPLLGSANQMEAAMAAFQKRAPVFEDS